MGKGRHKLSSADRAKLDILSGYSGDVDGWRVVLCDLGCGEGRNGLVWRPLLPRYLAPSDLPNMVRTRSSLAMAIKWHQRDTSAPLTVHTLHLRSVSDDIIVTPLAGPAAVQAVAQHATCHLAAHGKLPSGSDRLGILAMEQLYPDGYDDADAGAIIDIMRLWHFWDAPQRRALLKVQVRGGLNAWSSLHVGKDSLMPSNMRNGPAENFQSGFKLHSDLHLQYKLAVAMAGGPSCDEAGWILRICKSHNANAALQDHPRVQLMRDLLDASNAKQLQHHLAAMASCTCPLTWYLFASELMAQEPSRRLATLQELQLLALKHELASLISPNNTSVDKLYLYELAPRLLLTGPPAEVGLPMTHGRPTGYASQRVQQRLWSGVLELMPQVSRSRQDACMWTNI